MLHINFKLAIRATKIRSLADFQIFLIIRDDQLITCLVPAWLCFYARIHILNCLSSSARWLAAVWEFCIFPQVATAPPLPSLLSLASHKSAQDILGLLDLRLHHEGEDEQWALFTEQPPYCKDGLRLTCIKWSFSHCPGYEDQQGREISITILWGNRYEFFFMMIILAFLIQTNSVSKYWSSILSWHEARRIVHMHVTLIISKWVFLANKCVDHDIKIITWSTLTFQNWLYI